MAATRLGYPYPVGTDRVMDGDDAIKALAEAVDLRSGAAAAGQISIPITAAGVAVSAAVTYPAGRFTANPVTVACVSTGSNSDIFHVSVTGQSPTGCVIWGIRSSGTAAFSANWQALQL